MTAETSQTLDRGLRVLKLLADTDHGLTVTELSHRLGVNRTVIYRLLATLEQHALIRRDLGGRARVGLGVLRLGRQVHPLVREAALPALRSLAEEVGATAHLTLVDGQEALAVAVVEPSWTDYHVAYRTGFRHPLDRGAAGRAILAGRQRELEPAGAEPAVGMSVSRNGYGDSAVPTEELLTDGGFVLTHGELEAGASGAAAPLLGVSGIEGSVGVVMLSESVPERIGHRVVAAAREVSDALR
ncbi:IclR family transcriptional regulator [Streptomyces alkaliterrae]|uniref:Helix-turn-helix domain-containing protein n=1 Tax=Streptomyces alkaliterrae TaxID=2213162 RepID=A0A5P0YV28_9ACTN|nr:helix-turn-helix domain-containing protein [Streptomyces alkaliterrae]MBB1255713.1 helix-turn-helix domain-containing protein [Streptomyces alkaliterrae]MBB1261405.1 helix-turn-helix domain-containing protein [Streptomyces alkaliterrae]MQS04144.1 helix-turn-helix domain-containing protein [Streptomyces alkaliterrae]